MKMNHFYENMILKKINFKMFPAIQQFNQYISTATEDAPMQVLALPAKTFFRKIPASFQQF